MDSFLLQLIRIIPYWLAGIVLGAVLKTFQRNNIDRILIKVFNWKSRLLLIATSSILGAVSPITLFGVIPILYALDVESNPTIEPAIVAFITSSILVSPNIFIFTISLGLNVALIRLASAILAGVIMGLVVDVITDKKTSFIKLNVRDEIEQKRNSEPSKMKQLLANFYGAFRKTGINLLIGIVISYAMYQFIPQSLWDFTFQNNNIAVPISAVLSTFLYQCGGGSIPILQGLMREGLSIGAATTFMLVGPLTKITNLAALKSIMSIKGILIYCGILVLYMLSIGWLLG